MQAEGIVPTSQVDINPFQPCDDLPGIVKIGKGEDFCAAVVADIVGIHDDVISRIFSSDDDVVGVI